MAERLEVYKCADCDIVVEVLTGGTCKPGCCDKTMELLDAKTADAGKEKHVPVIEVTADGIRVKVGDVPHPMEEKHYIEWIELLAGNKAYRQFLHPGQPAEAVFPVKADKVSAREHCNVHGMWKA